MGNTIEDSFDSMAVLILHTCLPYVALVPTGTGILPEPEFGWRGILVSPKSEGNLTGARNSGNSGGDFPTKYHGKMQQ